MGTSAGVAVGTLLSFHHTFNNYATIAPTTMNGYLMIMGACAFHATRARLSIDAPATASQKLSVGLRMASFGLIAALGIDALTAGDKNNVPLNQPTEYSAPPHSTLGAPMDMAPADPMYDMPAMQTRRDYSPN